MFSVMYTGVNFLPLCTAMVWPTHSGSTVERRDQVRSTFFSLRWFMPSSRACRNWSTNGPFFCERMSFSLARHDELIGALVVARLVAARRLAPGGDRMPAAP